MCPSDKEMAEEYEYNLLKKDREDHENAERVADWHPLSRLPYRVRLEYARNFGENWASILSGLGDQ